MFFHENNVAKLSVDNEEYSVKYTIQYICSTQMFYKIGILKNFSNFTAKRVKYVEFSRTPLFKEYLRWLFLTMLSVRKLLQQAVIYFAVFC